MKYKTTLDGSYIVNCFIDRRETDPSPSLFYQKDAESIIVRLNGYAIIPIEKYRKLTKEDMLIDESQIAQANKDFYGEIS